MPKIHPALAASNAAKVWQIPSEPKKVVIPTLDEVTRLFKATQVRLRPIVQLMAETGCRKGEALHLTWDCVDEVNGAIEIRRKKG